MTRLTLHLSSHLVFWSLLATTPLMAMETPKGDQKPKESSRAKLRQELEDLKASVLDLRKHVDDKAHETREDALKGHGIHSQIIGDIRTEVADLSAKVEANADEIGTVFARYDQASRESIAHFREELTKCSDERFVKLEKTSQALATEQGELLDYIRRTGLTAKEDLEELSTRFDALRESLSRIEEIRAAKAGGEACQQDGAAKENAQLAALREDFQRQIGELNREVDQLKEAIYHEESSSDNALDVPVDGLKIFERVQALIAEAEERMDGKLDGIEELFDIGIKELKTKTDDLEEFYDNELIELHTRIKDLPSFEEQLQTFCVNNALSINHPITALVPLGIYHGCNGSEWVEKLVGFINSTIDSTTDPKPITALIKRTLLANVLNALLPKTGVVSHAKNGWAYMATYVVADLATEWTYPLVSGYVPEQVTCRYQQLPEFAQSGLPWLGKSLLAFAIAPGA